MGRSVDRRIDCSNVLSGQDSRNTTLSSQEAKVSIQESNSAGVVIVGGGLTAANVATTLRELHYEAPITVIGDEQTLPYERPPLSKEYLLGTKEVEDAIVHDEAWYREHDVTVRLGEHVESIDREQRTVRLGSGTQLPYEWLVLATGANSRKIHIPGADLPGVAMLRRVEDARYLREQISHGGRLAIVGAGWIGLEVASSARQQGMDVTIVAPGTAPLERIMGERIAGHFAELHRTHGVNLRMGAEVTGILERDGQAAGLATTAGDVEADRVLIAIGAVPATELAEASGLEVDNGILTDAFLRTSDPRILAAGDVANAEHTELVRLRVEHWDTAIRHGKLAAQTIVGTGEQYDWQPYFFTDQFDLGMEYVGHAGGDADVVIRGDMDTGEFIAFWLTDGVVRAAMNVNIWDVNDTLRALVGCEIAPASLENADIPLEEL